MQLGVPADREAMSCRDRDANSGEASRANANEDAIRAPAIEEFSDHRHQPLRMAASDQLVALRDADVAVEQSGGAGGTRRVEREKHDGIVDTCGRNPQVPELNRLYGFHFGDVVADEAFDAALQCYGRGRAARAGAMHRQIEPAVAIALVGDVAAALRDRGTNSGFDQFLDLVDDVGVLGVFLEVAVVSDVDS